LNIFFLDPDPAACAQGHADRHVIKMTVETTQILCSAYYFTGQADLSPYKLTHANHPCCRWVRETAGNWKWLYRLGVALCGEYTYRFDKIHKCEGVLRDLPLCALPDGPMTPPPLVMPEKYWSEDAVNSYRRYYLQEKQSLLQWRKRGPPDWA
jgi:hypothetical protein